MLRDNLQKYRAKRNFARTPEPSGTRKRVRSGHGYVIQKHAATREHYDFRLEHNGVLLSWATPKGPSLDPGDKRLAVRVEDHPIEYGDFEGTIPKGQYGGGTVMLWDRGTWEPYGDVDEGLAKGKLSFTLCGERLKGHWALVRLRSRNSKDRGDNWLLIKEKDEQARPDDGAAAVESWDTSVKTGRTMQEIAEGSDVWISNRADADGRTAAGKATRSNKGRAKGSESKTSEGAASGARKKLKTGAAKIPPFVGPQLATLVEAPPDGNDWLHEIKFDGYRALASIADGSVIIRTRNGLDWTDKFAPLVAPLAALPCRSALLDGEVAVADAEGHTKFGALQDALSTGRGGFGYYLFDLLYLDGKDWRERPLIERKRRLERLLEGSLNRGPLAYSSHVVGHGRQVFDQACELKLEGVISKRGSDPYRSGRTQSWLKSKCGMEQEFVVVGWQPSDKPGRPFASILLAAREEGELRYCGRVGSGFSGARLDDLAARFQAIARKTPPVRDIPKGMARGARFVEPVLVAEVAFRGWTDDGMVRQGSFKGLREDKPARAIVRERPMAKSQTRRADGGTPVIEGVAITHPDRVLYPEQGITKQELIDYYVSVADHMLPYLEGRPLALVRCPQGYAKECFFQKHASRGWPDAFGLVRIREKSRSDEYMYIEDARGLVAAAQMGVLELHVWGSRVPDFEKPDRMVFDLDPDEGLDFGKVKQAARDLKTRLNDVGLQSFAMVTGGKGVHVVVPLTPGHSWEQHRAFAEALARLMAEESPDRYVATMSKAKRRGKIFVDYLRNQRGSTAIAPFSTRARPGAHVALPVSWPGLNRLDDAHPATIKDALRKLPRDRDPWQGYHEVEQDLPFPRQD
jgi:bifunctional non-homologous end joining protein LigD